jgi:hypothetical protein
MSGSNLPTGGELVARSQLPGGSGLAMDAGAVANAPGTGRFISSKGLTRKQKLFVQAYAANGGRQTDAARAAGYADPAVDGYKLSRNARVIEAIYRETARRVATGGAVGVGVLVEIAQDKACPPAARVTAADGVVDPGRARRLHRGRDAGSRGPSRPRGPHDRGGGAQRGAQHRPRPDAGVAESRGYARRHSLRGALPWAAARPGRLAGPPRRRRDDRPPRPRGVPAPRPQFLSRPPAGNPRKIA